MVAGQCSRPKAASRPAQSGEASDLNGQEIRAARSRRSRNFKLE
jgi:hypothetical protein